MDITANPIALAARVQEQAAELAFLRERNTALATLALAREHELTALRQQLSPPAPDAEPVA